MSNEYDESGNKLIHVKAYNRSDGTYVKEHWRGKGESFAPKQEERDWPPKDEIPEFPEGGCFPNEGEVMYLDGDGPVLKGGVEKTDFPVGEGGVFGEVLSEILEILPIIMQIIVGFSGGGASAPILKGNFEESMSKVKEHQNAYKVEMDNLLKNVVLAPTQEEYSKHFDKYVKAKNLYDTTQKAIYKVEHNVHNDDYKSAQDEIQSLQREINRSFSIPKEQKEQLQTRQMQAKQLDSTVPKNKIEKVTKKVSNVFHKSPYQKALSHKNTGNKLFFNKVAQKVTPDAAQFWNLFSNNFDAKGMEYVNQNGQVVPSIKNLPPDWQQVVYKKVKQQTGIDDCVGVIFNENSSISKSIAKSKSFEDFIMNNIVELSQKGVITNKSMAFSIKDFDNANAIGRADVPIATLDNQGNLTAIILDTYDFNEGSTNPAVQYGYKVQNAGIGLNYYSLIILKLNLLNLIFNI